MQIDLTIKVIFGTDDGRVNLSDNEPKRDLMQGRSKKIHAAVGEHCVLPQISTRIEHNLMQGRSKKDTRCRRGVPWCSRLQTKDERNILRQQKGAEVYCRGAACRSRISER